MTKKQTLEDALTKANQELKAGNIGLTIEQSGSKLCLRGSFPPKPNSRRTKPNQQRLSLGIPATMMGIKAITAKAKEISGLLSFDRFEWNDYLPSIEKMVISEAVTEFGKAYFDKRERNAKSVTTWREDYWKPFRRLPQGKPLTAEILKLTILTETKPDTRQRKRFATAYACLADWAKLEHDLRSLRGNYSPKAVNPRSLPDDRAIAQYFGAIDDPQWRWAYGMMACYGLRNHEVFFCDLSDFPVVFVERGKTNERHCYPLYPEWADDWELRSGQAPNCSGKTNGDYGSRVTHAFYRFNIPFSPYDLRHSWARRAFEFDFEPSFAARLMGHSLKVHCDTYRHWIDESVFKKAYERLMAQPNRPLPPSIPSRPFKTL